MRDNHEGHNAKGTPGRCRPKPLLYPWEGRVTRAQCTRVGQHLHVPGVPRDGWAMSMPVDIQYAAANASRRLRALIATQITQAALGLPRPRVAPERLSDAVAQEVRALRGHGLAPSRYDTQLKSAIRAQLRRLYGGR